MQLKNMRLYARTKSTKPSSQMAHTLGKNTRQHAVFEHLAFLSSVERQHAIGLTHAGEARQEGVGDQVPRVPAAVDIVGPKQYRARDVVAPLGLLNVSEEIASRHTTQSTVRGQ